MRILSNALSLLIVVFAVSCKDAEKPEGRASLKLNFSHYVDGEALQFNTARYTNALGEVFSLSKVRYYISNIKLRNKLKGEVYLMPESYHLVGTEDGDVFEILIEDVPIGDYNQMEFAIGVDNSTSTSTDKVGALDPSNDMAWNWNTGYKFLLVEGTYYAANDQHKALVYHVGGDPSYRKLTYTLGEDGIPELSIIAASEVQVNVWLDIAELFRGPNTLSFEEYPVVKFDPFAVNIADNYASDMFIIKSIE
ncbi:hypothetical protein OKW21_000857 [Catalinimonas alkaloidigena]|uniref:MbnP family protein n=1 Tax=Catalinimonas alkaloidigena TaxID=1075417 RepID=UPI002406DFA7|nr:MbnP family protein [Catalinimonas alkaloidigena]MDF9795594.1 hypothetical protein [Catalinimonas alkaloidigena]